VFISECKSNVKNPVTGWESHREISRGPNPRSGHKVTEPNTVAPIMQRIGKC